MKTRLLALVLGAMLGLAVAEGAARLLVGGTGADEMFARMGDRIEDPVLGQRGRPGTGENDARGWRNPEALSRADVVALGDSQTWGVNARIDEAWPAVLAQSSGLSVYNMGRGGYGMLQLLSLLDEALELSPRWIVVTLYLGNDLHDATTLAYELDAYADRRSPDPQVRRSLASPERPDPQQMFFERLAYQRASSGVLRWLEDHTALGSLVARALVEPADTQADRAWAADHPEDGFVYESDGVSTVFHASYRLAALDPQRARVREGLRITEQALADAAARVARAPDVQLLVLLLPTKERVFARAVARSRVAAPTSYARAVAAESHVASELEAFLHERGIPFLDALPALEDAVDRGQAIFPPNADGHLTAPGYRVVAEAVARRIEADTKAP